MTEAALFKNELMKDPNIIGVSAKEWRQVGHRCKIANDSSMQFAYETIDESYLPVLKIPIVEGRNFSTDFPSDSTNSVIVNESFVKKQAGKTQLVKQ